MPDRKTAGVAGDCGLGSLGSLGVRTDEPWPFVNVEASYSFGEPDLEGLPQWGDAGSLFLTHQPGSLLRRPRLYWSMQGY